MTDHPEDRALKNLNDVLMEYGIPPCGYDEFPGNPQEAAAYVWHTYGPLIARKHAERMMQVLRDEGA